MQCSRGFDPAGTLHQPESRLPGFGHARTVATTRLSVISGRVLQSADGATRTVTYQWGSAELLAL
jgi:hypothetical protein